jgi:hypothetical protein
MAGLDAGTRTVVRCIVRTAGLGACLTTGAAVVAALRAGVADAEGARVICTGGVVICAGGAGAATCRPKVGVWSQIWLR